MSVSHFLYGGFYLKCEPKTVEVEASIETCDNGHEKRWDDKAFCGRCGTEFNEKPATEIHTMSWYDLHEDYEYWDIPEKDAEVLLHMFDQLPSNCQETHILLFNDERTHNCDPDRYEEENDLLWLIEKHRPSDVREELEIDGVIDLLTKYLYDDVELRFGVVQGWA